MKVRDIITERITIPQGASGKELYYLQDVAEMVAAELGLVGVDVVISFDPPYDLDKSQYGATIGISKDGNPPERIFVLIDKDLSMGEKVLYLCHEMIHVEQLASGRLLITNFDTNAKTIDGEWEGEKFEGRKYSKRNEWEVEAHTRDKKLRDYVLKRMGNFKG